MQIQNLDQLRDFYGFPSERAVKKQLDELDVHSMNFIRKSPFLVIATGSKAGAMDVSPRGGKAGFVHILNNKELLIPDIKGNTRIDSLSGIKEIYK